ncbi:MAG: hypothetical protein A3E80_00920 [Chlamydiae bacterium RIFCSPHIGHO2_12_FULL_49_9]|nr:MAG: hypothetical protein A3E80_00920 [Chlamydiae bacterium RIFCSPHIGHO2_12_FULL_49_9]
MNIFLKTVLAALPLLAIAEEEAPFVSSIPPNPEEEAPVFLKQLVLADATEDSVSGKEVDLDSYPSLKALLEEKYFNQPLTETILMEIRKEILSYFNQEEQFLAAVEYPIQEVSSGVVTMNLLKAKVGKVTYPDSYWFTPDYYQKRLYMPEGSVIDKEAMLNNIAWINRNPFQFVSAVVSPGEKPGMTDIAFQVRDRFPVRFYVGADNTGTSFIEQGRLFTGFTWGNFFGRGDLLSFQYTGSPDFHRFKSYYGNYTCYLPWKHTLILFGGYATIHPDISSFKSEGQNGQMSGRYTIPFKPLYTALSHEVLFGYDFKNLNNSLFFVGETLFPVVQSTVQISQFVVGYQLQYEGERLKPFMKLELFFSPAEMVPKQNDAAFQALRPGAEARYAYGKGMLSDVIKIPRDFSFAYTLRGQYSSTALIASEQFPLGGYDTVRGYDERVYNSDSAVCVNLEIRSPPRHFSSTRKDALTILAFFDYGFGHNRDMGDGVPSSQYLMGVGPGIRYTYSPFVSARIDYGFNLHSVFGDSHSGRVHVGITAGY